MDGGEPKVRSRVDGDVSQARGAHDERALATERALEALAARRWRVALVLTGAMLASYFGFVLLVAYRKSLLGQLLAPGLSLGILLGALVIVVAWGLTGVYVHWANRHYDAELMRILEQAQQAQASRARADEASARASFASEEVSQ